MLDWSTQAGDESLELNLHHQYLLMLSKLYLTWLDEGGQRSDALKSSSGILRRHRNPAKKWRKRNMKSKVLTRRKRIGGTSGTKHRNLEKLNKTSSAGKWKWITEWERTGLQSNLKKWKQIFPNRSRTIGGGECGNKGVKASARQQIWNLSEQN